MNNPTPRPPAPPLLAALAAALLLSLAAPAAAKIELVTLPASGATQLTIYNSVDLTLVRDDRSLTLKKGLNRIEFSWANTKIDPSSCLLEPLAHADRIRIVETVFPPRVANTLVWTVESDMAGECPMRISYFTSGIGWAADHALVMNAREDGARLATHVGVNNGSGEDYADSQVRLIVGKVRLVERIDDLADRQNAMRDEIMECEEKAMEEDMLMPPPAPCAMPQSSLAGAVARPKAIRKEALSEYFIYSIPGTETIENGWSKRMQAQAPVGVKVESVFRHEDFRLGPDPVRFVTFRNDKAHGLGDSPLPDGMLRILKEDARGNLQYLGGTSQKYAPIDATVEVNLGADREVKVEVTLVDYRVDDFSMDHRGDPDGWTETHVYKVRARNFKSNPVRVEMKRRHRGKFEIESKRAFEMEEMTTALFKYEVPAGDDLVFHYTLRTFHGVNAERR